MKRFRLDEAYSLIESAYSSTGRPALFQAEIFRSFLLMQRLGYTSIKKWVADLSSDSLLRFLIGCTTTYPSASSHYDFISRFACDTYINELHEANKNFKPKAKKPKKGKKLENMEPSQTARLVDYYLNDGAITDRHRSTFSIQSLFNQLAVIPSPDLGLIDNKQLGLSGDGTSFHLHANPNGKKVEDNPCFTLTHRYFAPNADIGWDSDLETYYFGYTLYNISYYSKSFGCDLPCYIHIDKASVHDALSSITAFSQFLDMNPEMHPTYFCLDSASDNYPTHELLIKNNVIPLIDINKRSSKNIYVAYEGLDDTGTPLCSHNILVIDNGHDYVKHRHKYRCPLVMAKLINVLMNQLVASHHTD